MADKLYPKGAEGLEDGSIDLDTDDIRCMLVKTGGTYNAAHDFLDDLSTSYDNGRTVALTGKSCTLGVVDANDTSLAATAAVVSVALVIYKYNAADSAARLIAWLDSLTGLPFTPAAGQTINVIWNNGASKIFSIGG